MTTTARRGQISASPRSSPERDLKRLSPKMFHSARKKVKNKKTSYVFPRFKKLFHYNLQQKNNANKLTGYNNEVTGLDSETTRPTEPGPVTRRLDFVKRPRFRSDVCVSACVRIKLVLRHTCGSTFSRRWATTSRVTTFCSAGAF